MQLALQKKGENIFKNMRATNAPVPYYLSRVQMFKQFKWPMAR